MTFTYLAELRSKNPLVHNITNIVSAHFSANGLLAIGASPFMSSSLGEMDEVANIADVLVINMGGVSKSEQEAMIQAGQAMNRLDKPVVLDPVGAGATPFRQAFVKSLTETIHFSAIRGNAAEMAFLVGQEHQSKGVDAGLGTSDGAMLAVACAERYQTIAIVSGETDYVSDGKKNLCPN